MPDLTEFKERQQQLLELTKSAIGSKRASLGNSDTLVKDTVPTNIMGVDEILGGGLRKGRIALVVGHESMGKTLFVQWVIKSFQDQGELCGYIDAELTYEPSWFAKTGVDVDNLIVAQPTTTETAFDLASLWAQNEMGLIIIDSLAALTPKARTDADLDNQEFIALGARKLSEGLNKFIGENTNSVLLCTNQLRENIKAGPYQNPDTIPGGKAQRFYASYILKVRRKGWIKENSEKVGYHMAITTEKNKLNTPLQEAIIPFMFSGVIDTVAGTVALALDLDLIEKKGAYFFWKDEKIYGRAKFEKYLADNLDQLEEIQELIQKVS